MAQSFLTSYSHLFVNTGNHTVYFLPVVFPSYTWQITSVIQPILLRISPNLNNFILLSLNVWRQNIICWSKKSLSKPQFLAFCPALQKPLFKFFQWLSLFFYGIHLYLCCLTWSALDMISWLPALIDMNLVLLYLTSSSPSLSYVTNFNSFILNFYFNICFLLHQLLTVSLDSHVVWWGCYSLPCPAYPFHIQPSNLYPLYLDVIKADNYILLCKHDCPLCFIENQTFFFLLLFLNLFYHYHVSSLVKYCTTHTYTHTQVQVVIVQSWCHVQLFVTSRTTVRQASLSTISGSLLKLMSIESVIPSNQTFK